MKLQQQSFSKHALDHDAFDRRATDDERSQSWIRFCKIIDRNDECFPSTRSTSPF
jgi:hypothetical protein